MFGRQRSGDMSIGSSLIPQSLIPVNLDLAYISTSLDTLTALHYGC